MNAFSELSDRIQALFSASVWKGYQPTEVWLGPEEARIFEVETNWQINEGRLYASGPTVRAVIRGDIEGAEIFGMVIRLMVKPGIRVGYSLP